MARYGSFNINKKKRISKPLIAAMCVLSAVIIALFVVGITTGSGDEEMAKMSAAVRENTELKQQLGEMTEEIQRLNDEINDLKTQLEAAQSQQLQVEQPQTGEDAAVVTPSPLPEPQSPREGFR